MKLRLMVLIWLVACPMAYGQTYDTLRVATYNLLNYPGTNSAARNPEFRKILHAIDADVLIVQEMQSSAGVSEFLNQVLNFGQPGTYANAPFQNGPDTDNAFYYKTSKVSFQSQLVLTTALRDINGYIVRPAGVSADSLDFRIYSAHLRASQGNESLREAEAIIVRDHLNALGSGHYIVGGDFNLYTSTEPAYQQFIGSQADNDGRLYDVLNRPGSWNNSGSFADIHTQSPRLTDLGDGGSTGGMDDRFDFLLPTFPFQTLPSWQVLPASYTEFGNDGAHFQQSINNGTNFAVPDSIADALHVSSDHLPVFFDMVRQISASATVVLNTPNGGQNYGEGDSVNVMWSTTNYTGTVSIALSRAGLGGPFTSFATTTANDGQLWWIASVPATAQARIQVTLDGVPSVSDLSNADFTIFDRDISIFTPAPNDSFTIGNSVDIQWTALDGSGTVRIELSRSPSSPTWELITASTPNSGFYGWLSSGTVTDSARIRILMTTAPTVGDTSGLFKLKTSSSNAPPTLTHNPLCDAVPGSVSFFCKISDTGAYSTPKLFWSADHFATTDSVTLSLVTTNRYSTTRTFATGYYEYVLRVVDIGGLAAQTDTLGFAVQSACPTQIAYDDGTAESYQWSPDSGLTWALKCTPPASPFVLCAAEVALSARKPDSTHHFVTVMILAANGPGGTPGDTLGEFLSGVLPNLASGNAGSTPAWGRYVLQEEAGNAIVVAGDFYLGVRGRSTAFGLDFSNGDDSRSFLWESCEGAWLAEDGINSNTSPGKRMFRVEGYALVPPVLVIASEGSDAVLRWTNTGAPQYEIYRATSLDGPFVTPVATTSDTVWTDTGIMGSLSQAFYLVRSATP